MKLPFERLVGPCALEFTRVKTADHLWSDPHADELVQRHRMHNTNRATANGTALMMNLNHCSSPKYRPSLQANVIVADGERFARCARVIFPFQLKRHASSSGEEVQRHTQLISINPAREYVESLHQNAKSQLIYGKNNVLVQPVSANEPVVLSCMITLRTRRSRAMAPYRGTFRCIITSMV